ncbi:histidine phosphatase superfamily [Xylariales sp. PMI_506]|nr:histidine phosphatase superfamily [Xylariales sp. PMI_506]
MHLLLIRHGESVDNVAGLYAGSRDSSLTNHGVLQAKRLGAHLAARCEVIGRIDRVFASNLRRASETAEAVVRAQRTLDSSSSDSKANLEVVKLPELREKDFGSDEGVKIGATQRTLSKGASVSDAETRETMMIRIKRFIDVHLCPLLEEYEGKQMAVAIVSHGIILGVLLEVLTKRFPSNSPMPPSFGFWSNTGVLQAFVERKSDPEILVESASPTPHAALPCSQTTRSSGKRYSLVIQSTNNVDHLDGLKKTRGGIGSAQFDSRQRTLTSFFTPTAKKRKAEDDTD